MPLWLTILFRSLLMFFTILVLTRLVGKKQSFRLTSFNFINFVVIGIVAALISAGFIGNIVLGFMVIVIWGLLPMALDYLALKSKWFHNLFNGKETILIKHGQIMEEGLFQARLTGEELLRELRSKNIFNANEIEFAVMETTGEINVLPKTDYQSITPHDLGQKVALKSEPQTVIVDGNILNENLTNIGLNRSWLKLQLERLGVSLSNVFLGQADSTGDLYIDLFDDTIKLPQPKVKELLYANLQKIQADLTTFALETQAQDAKAMYANYASKLEALIKQIEPYLLR
jgi:Predicted membrane protein